jgi:CheY-like chemotaxis protein
MKDLVYLYVEDDTLSREALTLIMKRVMALPNVYIFEDSTDFAARVLALPRRPDIILLDIHLRPLDGFAMLKILREELGFQKTTIVAVTASVMNEEVQLLKDKGFNGVIGKPFNISSFPTLLERVTRGESVWHITDIDY